MPFRWPDPIQYIYEGFVIEPEDYNLDTEDPTPPGEKQVEVRALDGFIFTQDGKFVYPRQGLPDEWWKEVTAFGYISALTGDFKHYIWAGQWDEDYAEKHHEVVVLGNLIGISWDADDHWRNGSEPTLWLDTLQGYSYALLEPAEEYDRGSWAPAALSWTNAPDAAKPTDGLFHRVERDHPRPTWWDSTGDDAWERFQGQLQTTAIDEGNGKARSVPNIYLATGSCDTEPIDVDLFSDVDPILSSLAPKGSFGHTSNQRVLKTVSKTKNPTRPGNRPDQKRKASSRPSKPRQRRKQEIREEIYVTSDSSDDEVVLLPPPTSVPTSSAAQQSTNEPHTESEALVQEQGPVSKPANGPTGMFDHFTPKMRARIDATVARMYPPKVVPRQSVV